ncbi:hypothetical protein A8139_16600 [Marinomonas primoryensis]|uniref:Uncharacterized protein n=1 Tax=Marinomonas primoryensis TaxID=178399 RepID=A0A2Z4PWI0_9GAMM|nr:hypothetical protein A8139_16600 [Marinomonas primoryensis]
MVYLPPNKQSMPYCPRASVKLFFDDKNQALKILKRPFGYFCGSGQKLHAQQSGIKVGNAKRLNRTKNNPILAFPLKKGEGTKPLLHGFEYGA